MNDDIKSMMDDLLSPGSLQPKIDVLESNINGSLTISPDELTASVTIKREETAAVTKILDKAVKQFFTFINIPESLLGSKLIDALEGNDLVELDLALKDHPENEEERTINIIVSPEKIDITINGYPAIQPRDETIARYYFAHEQYPGKLLPNGKFDFREIHRFPSVKQNDILLFINNPFAGRNGVTYSGRTLMVNQPAELELTAKSGVIREDCFDDELQLEGYYLKAATDGVIIIKKKNKLLNEIDVSNEVKLDKIDFTTGNIGTEFKSPVSMEIGEIGNEFKVIVDGRLKVDNVNGGIIDTNLNAVTVNIRDNSTVTARKNIDAKNVTDSELKSSEGTILITGEIRDSKLTAPVIQFICQKGQMLNSTIKTSELTFKGGYYCGLNTVYLGTELFKKRLKLLADNNEIEESINEIKAAIADVKTRVVPALKDLSTQIKDEKSMDLYRILIRHFQSLEFGPAEEILNELRKTLNVMQIDSIKKSFSSLQEHTVKLIEIETEMKSKKNELDTIEAEINKIRVQVTGEINHRGTIRIYCDKKMKNDQPVFEIQASGNDKNELVDISASYNLNDGFLLS